MRATFFLTFAIALAYAALRIWRRWNSAGSIDRGAGFRPRLDLNRLDGMASVMLLLPNGSKTNVLVEEIEIFLTDLIANEQTAEPACRGIQKVRQVILRGDTLPISLAEAIYKAAGDPQREYSCVLSSKLRYRIGEEQFEKNLENYRVRMIGLTASGIDRERKPVQPFQTKEESRGVHAMAANRK